MGEPIGIGAGGNYRPGQEGEVPVASDHSTRAVSLECWHHLLPCHGPENPHWNQDVNARRTVR